MRLNKIRRERIGDTVFQMLRQSILDQTFAPGSRLQLDELAAKLDVSVTPIKDAINRLAAEGLVEVKPRSGTFVSQISVEELAESLEMRCAIEYFAARAVVQRATADDLRELGLLVEDLDRPIETSEERVLHEQKNRELHERVVSLAGNRKMLEYYRSLNTHISMARVHYTSEAWKSRLEQERREHHEILRCIERRDANALADTLRDHIQGAANALIQDIRRNRANV
jgi:GntR family transcriptional regulator, rspAB operon transcriptional repressor